MTKWLLMKVFFVYAGRRGSNLECALSLYEIARQLGHDAQLILSKDNERSEQVRALYPQALFFNFFSLSDILEIRKKLETGVSVFTMISPKIMPLFLSLSSRKILYFHATYDYSYSSKTPYDYWIDFLQDIAIKSSSKTVATQYPLAWQIRMRLKKDAEVLPHPPYSPIKQGFFKEEAAVDIPFKGGEYFLCFGGVGRPSKGTDVLLKAVEGTSLQVVLAGSKKGVKTGRNVVHLDRWVDAGELHWLIKNCRAVVLPYLVSSQFSGCLALAFHFKKPVISPFSASSEGWVEEGKTGWLFSQGDWHSLREKMQKVSSGKLSCSSAAIAKKEEEMANLTKSRLKELLAAI